MFSHYLHNTWLVHVITMSPVNHHLCSSFITCHDQTINKPSRSTLHRWRLNVTSRAGPGAAPPPRESINQPSMVIYSQWWLLTLTIIAAYCIMVIHQVTIQHHPTNHPTIRPSAGTLWGEPGAAGRVRFVMVDLAMGHCKRLQLGYPLWSVQLARLMVNLIQFISNSWSIWVFLKS